MPAGPLQVDSSGDVHPDFPPSALVRGGRHRPPSGGGDGLLLRPSKVENALKEVPAKIGIEIQQSAKGFTVSRFRAGTHHIQD